jgi:hypothetical protein
VIGCAKGIENPAAKFENMVALELFRAVSNWNDMGWGNFGLHYLRTREGREVDSLVLQNRTPLFLVETKTNDDIPSPNLIRFQKALGVRAAQLLDRGNGFKKTALAGYPLLTAPAVYWLPRLPSLSVERGTPGTSLLARRNALTNRSWGIEERREVQCRALASSPGGDLPILTRRRATPSRAPLLRPAVTWVPCETASPRGDTRDVRQALPSRCAA